MADQLLTRDEFRSVLEKLDIPQREFARIVHVNERTVRGWVSDTSERSEPPNTASSVLLYLLASGVSAADFGEAVADGADQALNPRARRRSVAA